MNQNPRRVKYGEDFSLTYCNHWHIGNLGLLLKIHEGGADGLFKGARADAMLYFPSCSCSWLSFGLSHWINPS
jgi:hypothetical protein